MDYRKKYKEIVGLIKKAYLYAQTDSTKAVLEEIFPELSESEDEKVRKELIDAIQGLWDNDALPMPLSVKRKDEWLAWLKKQGEKKPAWSEEDEEMFDAEGNSVQHHDKMEFIEDFKKKQWRKSYESIYRFRTKQEACKNPST